MTARPASAKVAGIEEMVRRIADARAAGRRVALVQGEFDLLHAGHLRHLEAARDQADFLVVAVVGDDHLPHRGVDGPLYPDTVRAQMVASLESVDGVIVTEDGSPEWALSQLRPDVFVLDTADEDPASTEVAGGIGTEVIVTDDAGNAHDAARVRRYVTTHDPSLRAYLDAARAAGAVEDVSSLLERAADMHVVIVGDAIVDEYQFVIPSGKSVKENMIAALFQGKEIYAGGVFAAANHVASFCRSVELVTALGESESHEELIRGSLRSNVTLTAIRRLGVPTTRKSRFIDASYSMRKLFEVYFMDDTPLEKALDDELQAILADKLPAADVVIVTDFGHGLLSDATIELLIDRSPFLAVNAQSNSANFGYNLITKYRRADYVCIDGPEARLAMHDKLSDLLTIVGDILPKAIDCDRMVVTQGKHGCVTYDRGAGLSTVPALTQTIVDTVGAGDAFFAVTAPLVAAGGAMPIIGLVGNAAGALKVGIVGHRSSVEKPDLVRFLESLLA